jgi:hypothetical protein
MTRQPATNESTAPHAEDACEHEFRVILTLRVGTAEYIVMACNESEAIEKAKQAHDKKMRRIIDEVEYWQDVPFSHEQP